MKINITISLLGVASLLFATVAFSMDSEPKRPKIAVSNLAYQQEVKDYFFENQTDLRTNTHNRKKSTIFRKSAEYKNKLEFSSKSKQTIVSRTEFRELKQFVADIKGALIKAGSFEVVESRPYTSNNEKIYDVIERIKMKNFKGADYVLFGMLNTVQAGENSVEIEHTTTNSHQHFVSLQADFSLIEVRTLKVIAAFSSLGNAQQTILSDKEKNDVVLVNTARLMTELSKDLAADVIKQVNQQLLANVESEGDSDSTSRGKPSKNSEVTVYY
ncbi:hypothetical protein [Methylophilus aquaticus]|uniref:Uncharacterized protein n=1 Tax=Methylophilus aquaticus TaxID=1971610 RepID=A0ABT9JVW3_9PROT|nr:hypothetical protein [Methylophilus aquaticus]MDP8568727.1 hypothetical protein [Methylophilus aquaticus]